MKFSTTNAFLLALAFEIVSGDMANSGVNNNQGESAFWDRLLVQDLDSMGPSTPEPTETTPDPTSAPVETISDAPSDAPSDVPSRSKVSDAPTTAPSIRACESIDTIICALPEFSTLCALVDIAGLGSSLNEDTFTIFAPVNDAFQSLNTEQANEFIADENILRDALLYHAVPEVEVLAGSLDCNANLMMANSKETITICTDDGIFQVGNGDSPETLPKIIAQDGVACNGIIHAIDQVILQSKDIPVDPTPVFTAFPSPAPSEIIVESTAPTTKSPTFDACKSIADVICALDQFEILCALVESANLADVLGGEDKFTIFAPVDAAFESMPLELADAVIADSELLKNILLSHTVAGEIFSTDLECGGEISMVSGKETTTVCIDDILFQTGAANTADSLPEIISPDGVTCNGVIHAIDQVIIPDL